jgi:predicted NAD-dependent protein-ADP-ribosyltransferase YbiA (DUF1768 family)
MSNPEKEYEKLFTKFYGDLFKFQSGKKTNLKCPGCDSKKRFIIDNDKLTYSCGPNNGDNPKCGKQYTIILPKYINYRTLREIYDEQINGSFKYQSKDKLQYDLKSLSEKMDVKKELDIQNKIIKESSDNLNKLINDYIETNKLNEYIETLETLSEKRYKNSIEKKKLMRLITEEELSEPEKIEIRKKYAQLIKENKEFIDMIIELRKPNKDFIIVKKPEIINHQKVVKKSKENDSSKNDSSKNDKPKKYSFDEQVKILINYYKKVDPNKTETDIIRIINNRRPKGTPKGTRIPTKPWLELCDKFKDKYVYHPLRLKEEKDLFIEIQDDGSSKLVDSLSPDSPKSIIGNTNILFNPDIVFQFYSKSRDPEPGKGSGETIPEDKISEYKELSKIKDWRKMLSNFYESEFKLDDKRWLSVEHYYQGSKFKKENPEFYNKFSLDSESDISKDPNLAKSAGGKSGKSRGKLLRPENIKIDNDFFKNGRSSKEMKLSQKEKYSQNDKLKEMLLLTKDAKLTHFSRGSPPIVFTETMELRKEFK